MQEKEQMQLQIKELQDRVQMLEYIISIYEKGDAYKQELKKQMESRIAYLEAILPDNFDKGTRVIPISNIRKLRFD